MHEGAIERAADVASGAAAGTDVLSVRGIVELSVERLPIQDQSLAEKILDQLTGRNHLRNPIGRTCPTEPRLGRTLGLDTRAMTRGVMEHQARPILSRALHKSGRKHYVR